MVSIKNLKNNDDTLECDFYPMNKEENKCHMVIDKQTEEIISVSAPDGVECHHMDIGGARACLAKYIGKDTFPEVDYRITH